MRFKFPTSRFLSTLLLYLGSLVLSETSPNAVAPIEWTSIPTPPRFIHESNDPVSYFSMLDYKVPNGNGKHGEDHHKSVVNKPRTLRCIAVGIPNPEYKWLKDNKPFQTAMYKERVLTNSENGSLTFIQFSESDEGEYQCLATNDNGTAFSERIHLRQAWIRSFPEGKGPDVVNLPLGKAYARDCVPPESVPPATAFWLLQSPGNERQIQGINSSHISSNERGTIFFHYVQETDFKESALYTCAAYNQELKEYKFSDNAFNFNITKRRESEKMRQIPPEEQWVNQSSPIALLGHIHKLHCFFSGFPNPNPIWYHNGQEIKPVNTKGFSFENFGRTLVFNVTAEHFGRYDCKFEKHSPSYDRSFDIKVNAAPYWHDHPPANVNTSEGETVVFDCKSSGNPTPIVTFYKNGVEMRKPRPGENWVIEGSKLTIYDVKKGVNGQGDNAVYQCKAENKHGYLWTNFYLNLLAFQPQLLVEPDQVEAIVGRPFSISCKFFASPVANVTWESPVLSGAEFSTRLDQFGTGWLIFENIVPSNEGEYKCTGTNKYGSATGTVKLVVRKPTMLEAFTEQRIERRAGFPISLDCSAEHDPNLEPEYIWTINGKKLEHQSADSGHFRVLENNTLVVDSPTHEDSGVYTCVVSTKLDSASKSITINIEDVPPPVSGARISECNQTDPIVTINFEHLEPADRTKPVEEFWLRYSVDQEVDQGKWNTYPVPVKALNFETIGDSFRSVHGGLSIMLKPFGTYAFQVIARNAIGDSSPFTVEGTCQTAQKPPTRNPSNVRLQGTQPDNLIVFWDPMPRDEWNGEKFVYQILYRRKDEGGDWRTVVVEDPFANEHTIDLGDNSKAWDAYEVQVRAVNGQGPSKVSPAIVEGRTGEGDPGVTPTNFRIREVTATSAEFEWDPVDRSRVQGNFTGYKITYWHDEESLLDDDPSDAATSVIREARNAAEKQWRRTDRAQFSVRRRSLSTSGGLNRKTVIFSPNAMRGTITGLKPNSMNYATISVLNGQNEGTPSQEISFRTKEGVPTTVRDLHAYPMNFMQSGERAVVVLKWHPPRTLNGRLLKYSVKHCRAEPGDNQDDDEELSTCTQQVNVGPQFTETRIIRLDFDTNYRFILRAHTAAGEGLPASVDARTLPEALQLNVEPSRPSLTKEGIADTHFNVSFVPGRFNERVEGPVGNSFLVKYRETDGDEEWKERQPEDTSTLMVTVDDLTPGTKYDVMTVAIQKDEDGREIGRTESRVHHITTTGVSPRRATLYWIIAILLIVLLLLLFICIACCLIYQRGRKYPVAEKERLHGREPMLPKDRKFEEFGRTEEEKRSLSGHVWGTGESESDSLTEFGTDNDRGYNEDGSFVNVYGPSNKSGGLGAVSSQPIVESTTPRR